MTAKQRTVFSNILLIVAAAIWGGSFVVQKTASSVIGPITFIASRSILGSLTMIPIAALMKHRRKQDAKEKLWRKSSFDQTYFKRLFKASALCGTINAVANIIVQYGITFTTASKAGFINSIYIVLVPVVGRFFFKQKSPPQVFIGIPLAVIGLYNLCITESFTIGKGDIIILSATIFYAFHIQLINKYVHELEGIHVTMVEFLFSGILFGIIALFVEKPELSQFAACAPNILYSGILSVGVCYAMQVTAQKYTDPTIASLLMSLESAFGAIAGVVFLHESFTNRELAGIAFIIAAIIVSEIPIKKRAKTQ